MPCSKAILRHDLEAAHAAHWILDQWVGAKQVISARAPAKAIFRGMRARPVPDRVAEGSSSPYGKSEMASRASASPCYREAYLASVRGSAKPPDQRQLSQIVVDCITNTNVGVFMGQWAYCWLGLLRIAGGRESSKASARPLPSSAPHIEPNGVSVARRLALTMMELLTPVLGYARALRLASQRRNWLAIGQRVQFRFCGCISQKPVFGEIRG